MANESNISPIKWNHEANEMLHQQLKVELNELNTIKIIFKYCDMIVSSQKHIIIDP